MRFAPIAPFLTAVALLLSQTSAFASCTSTGYTKNCGGCGTEPAHGSLILHVGKTGFAFKAKGSSDNAGTKICLARVATPKSSLGGIGIKVSANGTFDPLKLNHGTLYRFVPSSNSLKKVKAITKAGIYQAVK